MITIRVRYYNILAAYANRRNQTVELMEGSTILNLIEAVAQENSASFREVVMLDNRPNPHLRIFCNNALVDEKQMNSPLVDGDEIIFFPALSGG